MMYSVNSTKYLDRSIKSVEIVYLDMDYLTKIDDLDRVLETKDLVTLKKPLLKTELRVIEYLREGYSYSDIAYMMGYSRAYISKVVGRIRSKVERS